MKVIEWLPKFKIAFVVWKNVCPRSNSLSPMSTMSAEEIGYFNVRMLSTVGEDGIAKKAGMESG